MANLREAILRSLDAIRDPATGAGLVAAGRVRGLEINAQGQARCIVEAPAGQGPAYAAVRDAVEAAVRGHDGVSGAQVALTAESAGPERARVSKGAPPPRGESAQPRPPEGVIGVAHLIAVSSAKGGVGKSTVAVNLALALEAMGLRVGLLDLDVYGPSAPTMLGLASAKPEIGPDGKLIPLQAFGLKAMSIGFIVDVDAPMIWRGPMATSAVRQMLDDVAWAPLDVLVLDLPPGTGDIQLTIAQRLPLSGVVIVSTPQEVALADVRRGIAMFERTKAPILGVIENMAWLEQPDGARLHLFGEGGARRTAAAAGAAFLGELPLDIALRESGDAGAPLVAAQPNHPMSQRFLGIARGAWDRAQAAAKPPPLIHFE